MATAAEAKRANSPLTPRATPSAAAPTTRLAMAGSRGRTAMYGQRACSPARTPHTTRLPRGARTSVPGCAPGTSTRPGAPGARAATTTVSSTGPPLPPTSLSSPASPSTTSSHPIDGETSSTVVQAPGSTQSPRPTGATTTGAKAPPPPASEASREWPPPYLLRTCYLTYPVLGRSR